jgi:hypothetical protein
MDNSASTQTLVKVSPLKSLLMKLLEAAGLSLVSFCVFMFLAKLFSPNPGFLLLYELLTSKGEDKMKFTLSKGQKKESFNLSQHWAGHLPEAAQEVLDIFNYPEVYSSFGSKLPRGYSNSCRINTQGSSSWFAWNRKNPLCEANSPNHWSAILLCFCLSIRRVICGKRRAKGKKPFRKRPSCY